MLCTVCSDGDVLELKAEVDPDHHVVETNEANNLFPASGTLDRTLHERRSIHITALPMDYDPPGEVHAVVNPADIDHEQWWMARAFPVPHWGSPIVYEVGPALPWSAAVDRDTVLNNVNAAYVLSGDVQPPDQVVVWVPPATGYNNGTSDPIWYAGQGVVTMVQTGLHMASIPSYDINASNRAAVWAHEVAHNLGRRHPCTGNLRDDPDYPYAGTDRGGVDFAIQETGVENDVRAVILGLIPIPFFSPLAHADSQHELMQGGHCGLPMEYNFEDVRWVSPYTYQQLFCALSPDSATASNCWRGNTVPIGSTASVEALSAGAPGKVESVLVMGVINADGTGSIDDVYRMEQGAPSPSLPGQYCLDLQKGGQAVRTSCFEPVSHGITEGPDLPASFARVLAWVEGSDRIVLRHGADVIEYIETSANAPAVTVTSPSTGGAKSGTQMVQWQAADADGDNMVFALMYSPDGGQRFVPIAANLTGTDSQADLDDLPGGNDAFFRVIASDNTGNSASADSIHFQVPNKPPHATILEPLEGSNYELGAQVTLMGSAADKEDRTLPSSAYAWSSSIDGHIGVGPTLLVADLSPGTHTITLTVTDSKGLADSKSVEIFAGVPALVDIKPDTVVPANAGASTAITAYLELPFGYQAADVDVGSLSIKVGAATLSPLSANLGDFDNNSLADLTLTFDGEAFRNALPRPPGPATATLNGQLNDGTPFRGGDSVSTVLPGDADCSGVVDSVDALAALHSTASLPVTADCLAAADINCDLVVNSVDALNILRAMASLPVNAPPDCPSIVVGTPAGGGTKIPFISPRAPALQPVVIIAP